MPSNVTFINTKTNINFCPDEHCILVCLSQNVGGEWFELLIKCKLSAHFEHLNIATLKFFPAIIKGHLYIMLFIGLCLQNVQRPNDWLVSSTSSSKIRGFPTNKRWGYRMPPVNWSMRENDNDDDNIYEETIEGQWGPHWRPLKIDIYWRICLYFQKKGWG